MTEKANHTHDLRPRKEAPPKRLPRRAKLPILPVPPEEPNLLPKPDTPERAELRREREQDTPVPGTPERAELVVGFPIVDPIPQLPLEVPDDFARSAASLAEEAEAQLMKIVSDCQREPAKESGERLESWESQALEWEEFAQVVEAYPEISEWDEFLPEEERRSTALHDWEGITHVEKAIDEDRLKINECCKDWKGERNSAIDLIWAKPLTKEEIMKDYTFVGDTWILIASKELRRILRDENKRVVYLSTTWRLNCEYASIQAASGFSLEQKSISELKSFSLNFFLKNESAILEFLKEPDREFNEITTRKEICQLLKKRDGVSKIHTLEIMALAIRRKIVYYDLRTECKCWAVGTHPTIQPEALSGGDIWIVRRACNCYEYDRDFNVVGRSTRHTSPIVPISPAEGWVYNLTMYVKESLGKCISITTDIDFLLFEFNLQTKAQSKAQSIKVTLRPGNQGACECIFSPHSLLFHLIEPIDITIKQEDGYRAEMEYVYISITSSLKKKCTTRCAHYNNITVEFKPYEKEIALWLFKAIFTGRPYDEETESEVCLLPNC